MKFSVNWLREFVDLPPKVEDLTELLTLSGVEIEGVEERGANFDKVVVDDEKVPVGIVDSQDLTRLKLL